MIVPVPVKSRIDPVDFFNLDTQWSDHEREVQSRVRQFVSSRMLPEINRWYDEGTLPRDIAPELGRLGVLGMHLKGYGCAGESAVSYGLACQELEAGDSGLRSFVSVQGSLAMYAIWKYGSDDQKEQWLPRMSSGQAIGCFGLTEPEGGSDPGSMKTVARQVGGDWVLNGAKRWMTNGSISDIAVVWARTDQGVRGFLVPRGTPGFDVYEIRDKLSLRASVSAGATFEDCRLPGDAMLLNAGGLRAPLDCLNEARFGVLWGAVGAARACYQCALDYSLSREQFGKPIAAFQLTQQKLVEMMMELNKAQLVALQLGRMKDADNILPAHVSFGKLNNVRAALSIAREARTILAANGITTEYPVMRHENNLESVLTYEGTQEIHTLILGESLTGIQAFR